MLVTFCMSITVLLFHLREEKSGKGFFRQSCTSILEIFTKSSTLQEVIRSLRLSNALKLRSKQTQLTTQPNAFITDVFKILLDLKIPGRVEIL